MKKYILVAILALLGLTSCVIESGYTPKEDDAAKTLYNRANDMLYMHAIAYAPYMIYADALLRDDAEAIDILKRDLYDNYFTEILEDGVKIIHINGYVKIKTGGKRLEEGGVWQLYFYDNDYVAYTCTGVVGQQRSFTVMSTNENDSVNINVSYRVTEGKDIQITFTGDGQRDMKDYTLRFNIKEEDPIIFRHKNLYRPIFGTMYIDYQDSNSGKKLSVSATAKLNNMEFENR